MTVHAPQIIYLVFVAISVYSVATARSEPMIGRHWRIYNVLAHVGLLGLLWWGGFFG